MILPLVPDTRWLVVVVVVHRRVRCGRRPGQACGYKIGQMKIGEVRARAEANLGDAFDIRAFHDLVRCVLAHCACGRVPVKCWRVGQRN